jgi:hypothetical protein
MSCIVSTDILYKYGATSCHVSYPHIFCTSTEPCHVMSRISYGLCCRTRTRTGFARPVWQGMVCGPLLNHPSIPSSFLVSPHTLRQLRRCCVVQIPLTRSEILLDELGDSTDDVGDCTREVGDFVISANYLAFPTEQFSIIRLNNYEFL